MSNDVTRSGGGLTEAPKLSPELQGILNRRKVVPNYGGEAGVASGGGDFRDGAWDRPEWVDQRDRDEARSKLPGFDPLLRPWTHDQIRQQFLLPLWGTTKHQGDANWDAVAIVYPMFLDAHPGWCFRRDRLLLAAQHAFQWFPSVQELVAFMEPDRRAILERVDHLRAISEAPTTPPKGPAISTDESITRFRERQDRERRELAEILGKRDAENGDPPMDTSLPPRFPGETDHEYVSRLARMCNERINQGAVRRKRDEERRRKAAATQDTGSVQQAQAAFREAHGHGPPAPEVSQDTHFVKPNVVDTDRLANFPDEPANPEDY